MNTCVSVFIKEEIIQLFRKWSFMFKECLANAKCQNYYMKFNSKHFPWPLQTHNIPDISNDIIWRLILLHSIFAHAGIDFQKQVMFLDRYSSSFFSCSYFEIWHLERTRRHHIFSRANNRINWTETPTALTTSRY